MEFQMSVKALTWAFEQPLAGNEKVVLLALADHADENGSCWPSIRRIAEKAFIAERTVRRILILLEQYGFISVITRHDVSGRSAPNRYELLMAGRVTNCQGGRVTLVSGGDDTGVRGEGDTVVTPLKRTIIKNHQKKDIVSETFNEFWSAYPKRAAHSRHKAAENYAKAIKDGATHEQIMAGVKAYAASRVGQDPVYTAMAATWLNQKRWEDDFTPAKMLMRGRNFV
jgi:DNA-binding transcriptional regulator YhcF (GntR family)